LVFAVSELFDYIESAMIEQRTAVRHRLKNDIGILRLQINDLIDEYEWNDDDEQKTQTLLAGLQRVRDVNMMGMGMIYELLTIDKNSNNHSINAFDLIDKMLASKENALHIELGKTLNKPYLTAIRLNMSAAQRFFILLDELITNAYKNNDDRHEITINIDKGSEGEPNCISVKISNKIGDSKQQLGGMHLGNTIIANSVNLLGGKIVQNELVSNNWVVHISTINIS
ncbi:MAG: hypothetical protein RI894_2325, partial [Bacteroidota bacterium]